MRGLIASLGGLLAIALLVGAIWGAFHVMDGLTYKPDRNAALRPITPADSIFCDTLPLDKCEVVKITNVHSIRQVTEGARTRYVFIQIDKDTKELKAINLADADVKVYADVPQGQPIWAEFVQQQYLKSDPEQKLVRLVKFHVRDINDLN